MHLHSMTTLICLKTYSIKGVLTLKGRKLCLKCTHFKQDLQDAFRYYDHYGRLRESEPRITYECVKLLKNIRVMRNKCRHYLSVRQPKLRIGGDGMVKIDSIEVEKDRVDLSKLPEKAELIALKEEIQEATPGRTGGLVITYEMRDGKTFPQKYSPMSATALVKALKALKYKNTTELFKAWHNYRLTPMRIGYPRMLPVSKVE